MLILHLSRIKCHQRQFLHFEQLRPPKEDACLLHFMNHPAETGVLGLQTGALSWHSFLISLPHLVLLEQSKVSQWSFEIVEHALRKLCFCSAKTVDLSSQLFVCSNTGTKPSPTNTDRRQIRLLTPLPGEGVDELKCTVSHVSLLNQPVYEDLIIPTRVTLASKLPYSATTNV
jgi:hypothetical protein